MGNTDQQRNGSRTSGTPASNGAGGSFREAGIPYDGVAEAAVLGSVLIDPEVWPCASRMLRPEDFFVHDHRLVFRAMTAIAARGDTISLLSLLDELESEGMLAKLDGGFAGINELPNHVHHSQDVEGYARIVLRHALRRLHYRMAEVHGAISQTDDPQWKRKLSDTETLMAEVRKRLGENNATGETPRRERFRLISVDEVKHMPPIPWLLGNILPAGALSVLFGEYGSAKSFLALDWALSIATGRSWHGHSVKQGPVVYIAGEGIDGMGPRIRAWELTAGMSADECGFHFIGEAPQLLSADDMAEVRVVLSTLSVSPVLVIMDTLSRSMAGADENQQKEMSLAVLRADEIRREFGSHVMLIHHKPHGADRERGSTVLPGAVDTRLEMARQTDGTIHLTTHKQKNAAEYPSKQQPMRFTLNVVTLDEEGRETSCVLVQAGATEVQRETLPASHITALLALYGHADRMRGVAAGEWERASALPGTTWHLARRSLMASGFVSRLASGSYILTTTGVKWVQLQCNDGAIAPDHDSA